MAHTLRFEWDVPETVFDEQFPAETFLTALKVDALCKLVTAGRLSSGYAAALLGITRRAFFDLLQQHHLPLVDYTDAAFAHDLHTLRTLAATSPDRSVEDAHVRRESRPSNCWLDTHPDQPGIPLPVAYRHMRGWQRPGMKLSGQRTHSQATGSTEPREGSREHYERHAVVGLG